MSPGCSRRARTIRSRPDHGPSSASAACRGAVLRTSRRHCCGEGAERALRRRRRDLRDRLGPRSLRDSGARSRWPPRRPSAFDGFVALGCVIRGETTHYDHICAETARSLQDLMVRDGLALGYGILTCENEAQALVRARRTGRPRQGRARRYARVWRMVELRRRFAGRAPRERRWRARGRRAAAERRRRGAAASLDSARSRRSISSS